MDLREAPRRPRARIVLLISALILAVAGAGTAVAITSRPHQILAKEPGGQYVFACVSAKTGKIDYLEFKNPLPHQCNAGDELWHWAVAPAVAPDACASPSPSPSPSLTATPSPTPSMTASPSPSASPCPSPSPAACATPSPIPSPTVTPSPSPSPTESACATVLPSPDTSGYLGSTDPLGSPVPSVAQP